MSLQPPSYFQAPQNTAQPQPRGGLHTPQANSKNSNGDELVSLKKENLALRQQLSSTAATGHLAHSGGPSISAVVSPPQSAALANDLLQVEAHLQSRVRLMEAERKELLLQVERLRGLLLESEERHVSELAAVTQSHQSSITKVQLDRDCIKEELQAFKHDHDETVSELQRELTSLQQLYDSEADTLRSRIGVLEELQSDLTSRIEQEGSAHLETSTRLQEQLVTSEHEKQTLRQEMDKQLREVEREAVILVQRVADLESYLGGEIPGLNREKGGDVTEGMTWKEERELLQNTVREQAYKVERIQSESKLLHIRLASLSEILSIQEADIAKCGTGGDFHGNNESAIKCLLSRWREKVFILLLQQRLNQIAESKENNEKKKEREALLEQIESLLREKEVLSYTLADRTAELELQTRKMQDIEKELRLAGASNKQVEAHLCAQQDDAQCVLTAVCGIEDNFKSYCGTFGRALTKMTNLDQRLCFLTGRMGSLTATLNCKLAILHSRTGPRPVCSEFSCQTENSEEIVQIPDKDFSSFSREHLERELLSLAKERDSLVSQLKECTGSFQQQIRNIKDTSASRLAVMDSCLGEAQSDKTAMEEQLSLVQSQQSNVQEEKCSLLETVGELQRQLKQIQATLERRVDSAVQEQKQKSTNDLFEMEKLVNVARREHAKAVIQLQQLQRHLVRDRDHAVEAVELGKARLEQELNSCQKKLQATQAERNLLMTTLRHEGIVIPGKCGGMKRCSEPPKTVIEDSRQIESEQSTNFESSPCSSVSGLDDDETSLPLRQLKICPSMSNPNTQDPVSECSSEETLSKEPAACGQQIESTDIREVLKDLQLLSASLLGLETGQANSVSL